MPARRARRHRAPVVPSIDSCYDAFMTERLYYADAYLRSFDARIVDRADDWPHDLSRPHGVLPHIGWPAVRHRLARRNRGHRCHRRGRPHRARARRTRAARRAGRHRHRRLDASLRSHAAAHRTASALRHLLRSLRARHRQRALRRHLVHTRSRQRVGVGEDAHRRRGARESRDRGAARGIRVLRERSDGHRTPQAAAARGRAPHRRHSRARQERVRRHPRALDRRDRRAAHPRNGARAQDDARRVRVRTARRAYRARGPRAHHRARAVALGGARRSSSQRRRRRARSSARRSPRVETPSVALDAYRARERFDAAAPDATGRRRIVERRTTGTIEELRSLAHAVTRARRRPLRGYARHSANDRRRVEPRAGSMPARRSRRCSQSTAAAAAETRASRRAPCPRSMRSTPRSPPCSRRANWRRTPHRFIFD